MQQLSASAQSRVQSQSWSLLPRFVPGGGTMLSTSGSLDGNAAASCVAQRRVRRHRVVQPTQSCIPIHGLVQHPEVITHWVKIRSTEGRRSGLQTVP